MDRHREDSGYTLVEMLAVLAVSGTAIAGAVPALSKLEKQTLAQRQAEALAADLQGARARSLARQEPTTLTLSVAEGSWELAPWGRAGSLTGAASFALEGATPGSFSFDQNGMLLGANAAGIRVAAWERTFAVRVSAAGRVSLVRVE